MKRLKVVVWVTVKTRLHHSGEEAGPGQDDEGAQGKLHHVGEGGEVRTRWGLILLLAAAILTAGGFWSWEISGNEYRENLLQAIRVARAGNNPRRVQGLTATAADYTDPDYLWLKRELTKTQKAIARCHGLYIMRMGKDGRIFAVCDSAPDGPVDPLPPGYVYEDTSGVFTEILLHGVERVWGPYTNEFGTWVTAAVPVRDDETGEIVAVLGVDVDYRDARMEVLKRALVPLAFTGLITLVAVGTHLILTLRRERNRQVEDAEAARLRMRRLQALAAVSASPSLARGGSGGVRPGGDRTGGPGHEGRTGGGMGTG